MPLFVPQTLNIKRLYPTLSIPALALVAQAIAAIFGWELDFSSLTGKLLAVVDAVFALLVILGIVVDPTTAGVGDSKRAMSYQEPWEDQ